jgi:hypothetical protein
MTKFQSPNKPKNLTTRKKEIKIKNRWSPPMTRFSVSQQTKSLPTCKQASKKARKKERFGGERGGGEQIKDWKQEEGRKEGRA